MADPAVCSSAGDTPPPPLWGPALAQQSPEALTARSETDLPEQSQLAEKGNTQGSAHMVPCLSARFSQGLSQD